YPRPPCTARSACCPCQVGAVVNAREGRKRRGAQPRVRRVQTQCPRETNEAFPRTPGRAEQAPRSEKLLGGVIGNRGDFTNRSFTHSRLSFTHTLFFLPLSITVARKFSIFSEAGVVLIRSGNGKIRDGVPRGFLLAD